MRAAVVRAADRLQALRGLVPVALVPTLVERRLDRIWADPAYRTAAQDSMEFLLGRSERAAEAEDLARPFAAHMLRRAYLRWHPKAICEQRVEGVEWLTTKRDATRGVLLSFAHHHQYDGLFASLARHGVDLTIVMTPDMMGPDAVAAYRQHYRVVQRGGHVIPSTVGSEGFADLLRAGATLAIASDVPGRTPVTFLGRRVLGSFGAPRLATLTDSPVVVVTTLRDADGPHLQVHEPLEPTDFPDPGALLDEMLRIHGEAVLAWPEAFESPPARFGALEEG